jgi:S1-C subfamily serine protease
VYTAVLVLVGAAVVAGFRPDRQHSTAARPLRADVLRRLLVGTTERVVGIGCGFVHTSGTGVAMADGRLLTNRHVVEGVVGLNIVPDLGPAASGNSLVSQAVDLAVVRPTPVLTSRLRLAEHDPGKGDTVWVGGFPGDDGLLVVSSRIVDYVDGRSRQQTGDVMRLNAHLSPGMSGSPVLDASGHLAGLVFGVEEASGYGLAIPASTITDVLAHAPLQPVARC